MAKMDRRNIFWKNLLGEDKVLLGNLANAENELGKKIPHGINLNLSSLLYGSNEDFEEIERTNDLMSRYIKYKLSALIEYPATGQKHFVQRSDDLDGDLVPLVNGRIDSTATADGSVHEVCDIKQKFPTALVFSRNGRHRVEHVRRLRCLLCISCKKISKQTWKNRMKLKKVLINNVTRVSKRSRIIKECSLIDYYYCRGKISHPITKVTVKKSSKSNNSRKISSNVKLSKKRRIGTVENPLFNDLSISHSVQHLIQYFSKLFEERTFFYENGSLETVRVDSSSEKAVEFPELPKVEGSSRYLRKNLKMDDKKDAGGVEDNEKDDDVRFPKLPMLRSTSRSPQSDEGIEPDPDQRRAFVARCWSVDSAVPSDDESFQNLQQQKGNEFRVTRCWSSDSAVLSDDEQNKAWGSSNSTEAAEAETNDGHPRYWRTPSVVVSDFSDYSYLEEKFERSNVDDKCDDNSASPSQASSCSCLDCDEIRQSTENSLSLDFHLLQICRHRRHSDSCCLCIDAKNSTSQRLSDVRELRRQTRELSFLSKMQEDFQRMVPKIIYTAALSDICSHGCNMLDFMDANEETERMSLKQKRLSRSRSKRNVRKLSISTDRQSSSSSRSPSPPEDISVSREKFKRGRSSNARRAIDVNENSSSGYKAYLQLLTVPRANSPQFEWGETSGDDLSSEWESDYSENRLPIDFDEKSTIAETSGWRKLRNIVHWTPFFQTYKKQRYPWVQLAGHQGNFRAGPTPGTILKKLCPQEEACFRLLMRDVLRPYVPEFKGVLDVREAENGTDHDARLKAESKEAEVDDRKPVVSSYLQLQDLLGDFEQPCVMDCKVGVRTYLESELAKAKERPKLRKDMYEKMVQVDPTAPTAEECRVEGVTKPRYMVWRETISSTATLGFRVEGIKRAEGSSTKDFKTTRTLEQVTEALKRFTEGYPHAVPKYLQRLKAIRATLKASAFFATHEVVGSSLLFVHDAKNASIWMIDFAKTLPLPAHLPRIRHDAEWQVGNHEDGYLIGINNLINIFQDIRNAEA